MRKTKAGAVNISIGRKDDLQTTSGQVARRPIMQLNKIWTNIEQLE
jgi:hypothetical protein